MRGNSTECVEGEGLVEDGELDGEACDYGDDNGGKDDSDPEHLCGALHFWQGVDETVFPNKAKWREVGRM